ncbi:MAG: polyketide cyclase [Acidimicrobiales bacterium]|nr:MAG: polyketide cyclase [Acidimicrobiales bacterium]
MRVDGTTPGGWADRRLRGGTGLSTPDRLAAEADIRQLVARYALATDQRDLDTLVGLFIPDVRVGRGPSGEPVTGHDALRENLSGQLRAIGVNPPARGYTPNRPTGSGRRHRPVYCRAEIQDGDRWIHQSIRYDDRYRRVDGHWLFVGRRHQLFYGAEVGANPLHLPPADWPANHDGWGTLPESDPTWQAFQQDQSP